MLITIKKILEPHAESIKNCEGIGTFVEFDVEIVDEPFLNYECSSHGLAWSI